MISVHYRAYSKDDDYYVILSLSHEVLSTSVLLSILLLILINPCHLANSFVLLSRIRHTVFLVMPREYFASLILYVGLVLPYCIITLRVYGLEHLCLLGIFDWYSTYLLINGNISSWWLIVEILALCFDCLQFLILLMDAVRFIVIVLQKASTFQIISNSVLTFWSILYFEFSCVSSLPP